MAEIEIKQGDVVALVGPDGTRRRYLASTLTDLRNDPPVRYELSDHCEDSPAYDQMLNDKTVLVLKWVEDSGGQRR